MDLHRKRLTTSPDNITELSEYPAKPDADQYDRMVQFLCTIGQLKTLDRTGWILEDRAIPKPEPVAGHMYRMGILAMLLDDEDDEEDEPEPEPILNGCGSSKTDDETASVAKKAKTSSKLNINKMVKMALIHDIAECIVGDITPFDGISEADKHARELTAMKQLASLLPPKPARSLLRLYEEYETRRTAESAVVKELDRFDVALQAFQYERSEWTRARRVVRFDEFFTAAKAHINNDKLTPMMERIFTERDRFWNETISKAVDVEGTPPMVGDTN